jgi:ribosomal-protein-alanine N-acetyltransferase
LLAGPGVFAVFTQDGFVLARAAGGEAEILTLAVAKAARGQGLGRSLLKTAAHHAASMGAQSLFLEVGADNPAALALYAGLGFVRVGQRKSYYAASGADAWVLKAELPLPPGGKFA